MSACTLNLTTPDENGPLHFHFNAMQVRLYIAWHLAISFFWICVFLRKCVYIVIKDSVLKISLHSLPSSTSYYLCRTGGCKLLQSVIGIGVEKGCVNPSPITKHASLSVSGLRSRHYRAKGSKFYDPRVSVF